MINYQCEDSSLCENFQAAICLHCDHRLCLQHLIEHDKIVFADVNKLSKLTDETLQQIKTNSEKSRIACDDLSPALDEWRTQELEKIEQIYEHELQVIEIRGEVLERFHRYLLEELERNARQPLERVQKQQNSNRVILNGIRETAEKLRKESNQLKWEFPTPSSVNTEYSPSEFSLTLTSVRIPMIYDIKSIGYQQTTNEKLLPDNVEKLRKGHPLKRIVKMFSDLSLIKQSQVDLHKYIQNQATHFKLPVLVCSYLTAWHKTSNVYEKSILLNEHISTIQQYLSKRKNDFDLLIGIQAFFYNNAIRGEKYEIMIFLLQFFLAHQCINRDLILRWYNENDAHGYLGFEEAKRLVEPFIKLLSTSDTRDKIAPIVSNTTST